MMKKSFSKRMIFIGFGSIGRALMPLLFRHFSLQPSQISIVANDDSGLPIAQDFGATFLLRTLSPQNYVDILAPLIAEDDFVINLSVNISSKDLIQLCDDKKALYIDTSTEAWNEEYIPQALPYGSRTNYRLRENVLNLRLKTKKTSIITHGANPGLISHFLKKALLNLAQDTNLAVEIPTCAEEWALLSQRLNIKAIHVAERDTQVSSIYKSPNEFVNTWSMSGFIFEGLQPAELGWGTHEKHWPNDAYCHETGCQASIFLASPGASVRVRSWTPSFGSIQGFLVTHAESTTIANFLSVKKDGACVYRPTVHYAYCPCPDAIISLYELQAREWVVPQKKRLLMNDIIHGVDELGVLLMGHPKGSYWFGSTLSIEEARSLVPHNSATTLQVACGVLAGILWAIDHPNEGVIEPEDMDHEFILQVASPYLGKVAGYLTSWTPLQNRESLFKEDIDRTDPWQFLNIRVKN